MSKIRYDQSGFGVVEVLLVIVFLVIVVFIGVNIEHNRNSHKTAAGTTSGVTTTPTASTATPRTYSAQEAVNFVQRTYDDYLTALNQANHNPSNMQPVAQVGLAAVKDNLSSGLYAKAAVVTQATPFSCTAQYVTDKYTASLSSSDKASAIVAVSISNGGGLHTDGMRVTVDLASLKITSVTCPAP